jgi:hypothetical protein
LVPDGTGTVDIFYNIDPNAEKVDVEPIILCVPDEGSEAYISGPDTWSFASDASQWRLSRSRQRLKISRSPNSEHIRWRVEG